MSRTFRKRWWADEYPQGHHKDGEKGSCWCCSQKRQRLSILNRNKRMKPSDTRRSFD